MIKRLILITMIFGVSAFMKAQNGMQVLQYDSVEVKPLYLGCDQLDRKSWERKICTDEILHNFIYDNLKYPEVARKNGVEGTVFVSFVIETDGSISNLVLKRDIGAGCGDEALRLVSSMQKWNPGFENNELVRVEYMLPIKFRLEKRKPFKPPFIKPEMNGGNEEPIYSVVDVKPEYLGGESEMLRFVNTNIKYPDEAKKKKITGTVYIRFVIEKDGTVSNAEVFRNVEGGCGEEALRVVKLMPKWKPGIQLGKPVRVYFTLPVKFGH